MSDVLAEPDVGFEEIDDGLWEVVRETVVLLLGMVLTFACAHPAQSDWADLGRACPPDAPVVDLPAAARDSLPPVPAVTVDDRWAALAREVPGGFGGIVLEGDVPVVILVDTMRLAEAVRALAERSAFPWRQPWGTRVRRARWDFAELYDWYRYLNLRLDLDLDRGWVWSDIDEGANRIAYGVLDAPARRRFERRLARLGVPCFLVALEIGGPLVWESAPARPGAGRDST